MRDRWIERAAWLSAGVLLGLLATLLLLKPNEAWPTAAYIFGFGSIIFWLLKAGIFMGKRQ